MMNHGGDPLAPARLLALGTEELLGIVGGKRWFATRGAKPASVRVTSVVPVEFPDGRYAVTRLEVVSDGGVAAEYQLPLAVDADGRLHDATDDPTFREGLATACGRGASFEGEGVRWVVEPVGATPLVLPAGVDVRLISSEQSNTSILIGDAAILKLFRRIQPGVHPDVEVTDFLTRRHDFPHAAVLLATLRFEEDRGSTVAGMLQELVPEATDAWRYALERSAPWFSGEGGAVSSRRPKPKVRTVGDDPAEVPFQTDARRLGEVTRELHEVLASDSDDPEFAPEPADVGDVRRWGESVTRQVDEALALLERGASNGALPGDRSGEVAAVLQRRQHYLSRVEEMVEEIGDDGGFMIRHHGDYHLGQVLRSSSGQFIIIDFEGEPARPLPERRQRHSALRDVAGMLRSFSYAAATLASSAGGSIDSRTREIRAGRWERACRVAFVDGYLGAASTHEEDETGLLPEAPENVRLMIDLFEMEKVFYELAYELNNRPDWVWIPLRGIAQLTFAR
jgi:trehalose synthase-fused probable maltokinase